MARDGRSEFRLQRPSPSVRRLLEVAGLTDVLPATDALPLGNVLSA
jgi:hypothetical protein